MKIKDLLGSDLTPAERQILQDALKRTGEWLKFEVAGVSFEDTEFPDTVPETADDALARLELVGASLDEKKKIVEERAKRKRDILKAAQKVVLAAIERGLPLALSVI